MRRLLFLFLVFPSGVFAQGKLSLFNGRNLDGWNQHGTEKWYVNKGELVCESGPDQQYGYLSTAKSYHNFILTLKFKQESNGNSGIFFRSSIDGVKISGWQCEVAPLNHHTGGIYESYGRGWLVKPKPEDERHLKTRKWNRLQLKVRGNEVISMLNGKEMIRLSDEKIGQGRGFIALQIHDGGGIKVRWRKIRIKELP
jgi:hypothetical protein